MQTLTEILLLSCKIQENTNLSMLRIDGKMYLNRIFWIFKKLQQDHEITDKTCLAPNVFYRKRQTRGLKVTPSNCLLLWKYKDMFQIFSYICAREHKTQSYTAPCTDLSSLSATVWRCWMEKKIIIIKKIIIKTKLGVQDGAEMYQLLPGNNSENRTFYDGDFMFSPFIIKKYYCAL